MPFLPNSHHLPLAQFQNRHHHHSSQHHPLLQYSPHHDSFQAHSSPLQAHLPSCQPVTLHDITTNNLGHASQRLDMNSTSTVDDEQHQPLLLQRFQPQSHPQSQPPESTFRPGAMTTMPNMHPEPLQLHIPDPLTTIDSDHHYLISATLPISMPVDDSFENFMWSNYNRYASHDDRFDIPQHHFTQDSLMAYTHDNDQHQPFTHQYLPNHPHGFGNDSPDSLHSISTCTQTNSSDNTSLGTIFSASAVPDSSVTNSISPPHHASTRRTRGRPRRKSAKTFHTSTANPQQISAPAKTSLPTTSAAAPALATFASSTFASASASASSPSSSSQTTTHESRSSHSHNTNKRERNRISARKCRQRTKSKLSELEDQADDMATEHESLLQEIKNLQYELIAAQVECMEHIRCRCPEVKQAMSRPSAHVKAEMDGSAELAAAGGSGTARAADDDADAVDDHGLDAPAS